MKLSVITVNYNNLSGLKKTIESVLNQTYLEFEYIIIDGGSTDGSADLIESVADRLFFWVSEKDSGIYNAMNKGVSHARGEFVVFMNSGDTFYSTSVLEQVVGSLDSDIVCGNADFGGGYIWESPSVVDEGFWLNRSFICHQSTFIRTELLKQTPYDEHYRMVADYKSFLIEFVINRRSYHKLDCIICNYDCNGLSSDDSKADNERIQVLNELRYNKLIEEDRLVTLCRSFKPLGRKYKLALNLVSWINRL